MISVSAGSASTCAASRAAAALPDRVPRRPTETALYAIVRNHLEVRGELTAHRRERVLDARGYLAEVVAQQGALGACRLELADATPAEAERGRAILTKLVG